MLTTLATVLRGAAVPALAAVALAGCNQASHHDGPPPVPQDLMIGLDHVTSATADCRTRTTGGISTFELSIGTEVHGGESKVLLITLQPYNGSGTYSVGSLGNGASATVAVHIRLTQSGEASPRTDFYGTSGVVIVSDGEKSGSIDASAEWLRLTGTWHCSTS